MDKRRVFKEVVSLGVVMEGAGGRLLEQYFR